MNEPKRRAADKSYHGPLPNRIRHARRLAQLTQAALARKLGVAPSAVAQWELKAGTFPTVEHLLGTAVACSVAFEWLSTGRGTVAVTEQETPVIEAGSFAEDQIETRLLAAFRRIPARKRETFVRCIEEFF
ncbi:MAG: helix-turn-helix transcriptional regulator [Xanthomonadales bacterium]|nr:helix-turn-helix transcriptional regulator [Xanthomonadales bacterium]